MENVYDFFNVDLSQESEKTLQIIIEYISEFYVYFDMKNFGILQEEYMNFVELVKQGYLNNSYHNFRHAIDACINLMYLLKNTSFNFTKHDKLALFLSMLCHDIGHFGRTGLFVLQNNKEITDIFKSKSPLEEYHLNIAYSLLKLTNLLKNMSDDDVKYVYNTIQTCIMATDPATTAYFIENENDNFKLIIKCADIGASCKVFEIHRIWTDNLMIEFYNQGTQMKEQGQLVPNLFNVDMKDDVINMANGQKWYFENYANPLYNKIKPFLLNDDIIIHLNDNYIVWLDVLEK